MQKKTKRRKGKKIIGVGNATTQAWLIYWAFNDDGLGLKKPYSSFIKNFLIFPFYYLSSGGSFAVQFVNSTNFSFMKWTKSDSFSFVTFYRQKKLGNWEELYLLNENLENFCVFSTFRKFRSGKKLGTYNELTILVHSSEKGGFSLEQLPTLAVLLKMCVLTF